MRHLTLLLTILTFNALAQIPNGNFEAWNEINDVLEPDEWITSNLITTMFGTVSAEQGSPAPVGSHFLSLTTHEAFDGTLPGFAMTSFAYADRPVALSGHVRYSTAAEDPALALVYLTRWDVSTNMDEVIGSAEMEWNGNMMNWQTFSMEFEYFSLATPDSAHIVLLSSTAGEPSLQNHAGFDDLSFGLSVGISENIMTDLKVFPIPADRTINLSAGNSIRELHILSAEGRLISDQRVNALTTTVDIADLRPGIYLARVILENGTVGLQRFVKN